MSKIKYLILTLLIFGFGITPVGAICNYEEQARLNREVSNVKVSYEVVTKEIGQDRCSPLEGFEDMPYTCTAEFIQINILNINENMTVRLENDDYDFRRDYSYEDTNNGAIAFFLTDEKGNEIEFNPKVTELSVEILASSETGCEGSALRTIYLTVPRYNNYYGLGYCDGLDDYYLCQKYVTYPEVTYEQFSKTIANEIAEREEQQEEELKWYQKIWEFVVEHKTAFIAGGIIIVVAGGGTAAYIIIRRRRDIV